MELWSIKGYRLFLFVCVFMIINNKEQRETVVSGISTRLALVIRMCGDKV